MGSAVALLTVVRAGKMINVTLWDISLSRTHSRSRPIKILLICLLLTCESELRRELTTLSAPRCHAQFIQKTGYFRVIFSASSHNIRLEDRWQSTVLFSLLNLYFSNLKCLFINKSAFFLWKRTVTDIKNTIMFLNQWTGADWNALCAVSVPAVALVTSHSNSLVKEV